MVMSRNHKTSKRKDLAFITFETHQEAKHACDSLSEDVSTGNGVVNILGRSVSVSIAFSQQAMQVKKKIKATRKKGPNEMPPHIGLGMQQIPMNMQGNMGMHIPQTNQGYNTMPNLNTNYTNPNTLNNPYYNQGYGVGGYSNNISKLLY